MQMQTKKMNYKNEKYDCIIYKIYGSVNFLLLIIIVIMMIQLHHISIILSAKNVNLRNCNDLNVVSWIAMASLLFIMQQKHNTQLQIKK